ncbi:hypothetical protein [uncultured Gemella sp.]|uniref:hypothetical protein n=1 Tax=uncultured Gemella sp. TaxID=254352 RepID=UPI00261E475E|nr:hypothetical protein [uncultured Gemella sp.]
MRKYIITIVTVTLVVLIFALAGYYYLTKDDKTTISNQTTQKDNKKPSTKENTELKAKENLKLILKKFQKLLILVRKFLIYYQIQIFLSINKAT